MQSAISSRSNAANALPHGAHSGAGVAPSAHHQRQQQLAKLDGVLYHFYSTTANVILHSRLISYRRSHKQSQESQLQARLTKWFALQIPELDLFREELRLWRSISSMLQLDADGRSAASNAIGAVPPLVIEVILDLSDVPDGHVVQLWQKSGTSRPPHFLASGSAAPPPAWEDQAPIDGRDGQSSRSGASAQSQARRTTRQVVLERWKLEFVPEAPSQPPELPTLYKRSITHFRGLFTLVNALPASRLCGRIEAAQRRSEAIAARKARRATTNHDDDAAALEPAIADPVGELDHELRIGCRLSMTEDVASEGNEGEVGIDESLPAEAGLAAATPYASSSSSSSSSSAAASQGKRRTGATSIRRFSPIVTPLGTMHTTVTFRRLADFSVQDAKSLESIREMQIEMEEDYFRPTVEAVRKRSESGATGARPDMPSGACAPSGSALDSDGDTSPAPDPAAVLQPAPILSSESQQAATPRASVRHGSFSAGGQPRPQSLLSATAHQRLGGLSAARASAAAPTGPCIGSMGPPTSIPSASSAAAVAAVAVAAPASTSSEGLLSRSPATNTSVFSTSASSRPIAGLSSLRRTGSITSNISNLGSSGIAGATPSSPALAAALSAEPAFLAMGQQRRPSTSERRMRSISSTSSGRDSPTSSLTAGSAAAGPVAANLPTSVSLRSSLGRVSSGAFPGGSPHLRSGSFSPSSPSPLIQQISLPRPQDGASGPRLSSSPSMRNQMAGVAVPSLRSVFQTYAPSPSSSLAHVSSPSSLGLRNSVARRSVGTSESGSISALGSSGSGARPQMIKRYSTNFGYRQARDQRSAYGSSLGMAEHGALGTVGIGIGMGGAEPTSLPSSGAGSLGSNYGRSWAARMEQRQQYSAHVRSSTSADDTTSGSAATSIRFRSSPAAGATPTGAYTPSPGSQDGDLDDLMRLIDSKPVLRSAAGRTEARDRTEASASGSGSGSGVATPGKEREGRKASPYTSESVDAGDEGHPRGTTTSGHSSPGGRSSSGKAGVYASIRATNPLSRSQVDEMLSRMMQSINVVPSDVAGSGVSPGSTGPEHQSAAPGAPSRASPAAEDRANVSMGVVPTSPVVRVRPSVRGAFDRPPAGIGAGSAPTRSASPSIDHPEAATAGLIVGTGQVRGLRTSADPILRRGGFEDEALAEYRAGGAFGLLRTRRHDAQQSGPDAALEVDRHRRGGAGCIDRQRAGSNHSLPYGEAPHSYDSMDDEAAGRMEMPAGDALDDDDYAASEAPAATTSHHAARLKGANLGGGAGIGGYQITQTRSGTSRSSPSPHAAYPNHGVGGGIGSGIATMDWERGERERHRELERRRADAEMARNFGNGVGVGTRGRGSRSPWRHGVTSPTAPSSVTHVVGFGAAMGVHRHGQGLAASETDDRRDGDGGEHEDDDYDNDNDDNEKGGEMRRR
ncbi:autophagy protein 13 [Thecaphora frezii]